MQLPSTPFPDRCSTLSIDHLLSLQTSLLDDLFYQKRLVKRLKCRITKLESLLKQSLDDDITPRKPDQSKMKQRPSFPSHPLSTQRGGNKPHKRVVENDWLRSKSRTNKRTSDHPRHQPSEKRWWRRNSPYADLPPQIPSPSPIPDPAPADKLPKSIDPCLSRDFSEEKELIDAHPNPDVDIPDLSRIPDVAESDVCLIQYHIPVAKCST